MKTRDKLLSQEVSVIIINMILGIGTVELPSRLAQEAGPDGIIAYLIAVGIVVFATLLYCWLTLRFPKQGFADYSAQLTGRVIGFILSLAFTAFYVGVCSSVLRAFTNITKYFLLQRTPLEVIMVSMLFATSILARNGLQPIARSCQIILMILLVPVFLLPFFIPIFEFGEFLPLFQTSMPNMIKATFSALFSLAGAEVLLIVGSHSDKKSRLVRQALGGVLFAGFFTGGIVILSFGSLSIEQTAKLTEPVFEMIKYVPVPILLLERVDIFYYTIWIAATYSTITIGLFAASHNLAETFKLESGKGFVIPLAAVTYYLATLPKNELEVQAFSAFMSICWTILTFGIVPVLILLSYIRKKGEPVLKRNKSKQQAKEANP